MEPNLDRDMNKTILLLIIFVACLGAVSPATAGTNQEGFGMGVLLGEPSGLSMKWWTGLRSAWAAGVGYSFKDESDLHGHVDYLWHKVRDLGSDQPRLPLYYGIGARYRANDVGDDSIGIRIPIGLEYLFASSSFDVFFEIVPVLDVVPELDFDANVGVGARYFF